MTSFPIGDEVWSRDESPGDSVFFFGVGSILKDLQTHHQCV